MTPNEIRERLLDDHKRLRGLVADAREALVRAAGTPASVAQVATGLALLTAALRAHNVREEGMLREILKHVDAWGPVRAAIMDESHVEEHEDLIEALGATDGERDVPGLVSRVTGTLDRLLAHMDREEEVLLAEDVLRDDSVVIDYFGG